MSCEYKVGDVLSVSNTKTGSTTEVVITKIVELEGHYCFFVRRKDNKAFEKTGKYNVWIKGPKIEVVTNE